jgi:hypothetical protein
MIRELTVSLLTARGPAGDALIAGLPEPLRDKRKGGSYNFGFGPDEVEAARELWRRVIAAGQSCVATGETQWTPADDGKGRLVVLQPPIGPPVRERGLVDRIRCERCGSVRYRMPRTASIDLEVPDAAAVPFFSTESGLLTVMSATARNELAQEGLLAGAVLMPADGGRYVVLAGGIGLGLPAGPQYTRRCPLCGTALSGAVYFTMFAHPGAPAHVYQRDDLGPGGLLVTERFARAAGRLAGDPPDLQLTYAGWYPGDEDLAAVPALDEGSSGAE